MKTFSNSSKDFENQSRILDYLTECNNFIFVMLFLVFDIINQKYFFLEYIYITEFVATIFIILSINKETLNKFKFINLFLIITYIAIKYFLVKFDIFNFVFWGLCLYYLFFQRNKSLKEYLKNNIKKNPQY